MLQVLPVPEVDLVDEGNAPDVGLEAGDFIFQDLDLVLVTERRVQILRRRSQGR